MVELQIHRNSKRRTAAKPGTTPTDLRASVAEYVGNIFAGIDVDVAVRDSDAWLYRLGYNITLLGKIVFVNNNTPQ